MAAARLQSFVQKPTAERPLLYSSLYRWCHSAVCAMNGKDLSLAVTDTHNQDRVRANHCSLHTYIRRRVCMWNSASVNRAPVHTHLYTLTVKCILQLSLFFCKLPSPHHTTPHHPSSFLTPPHPPTSLPNHNTPSSAMS